ncbi:MAG: hypothetical protein WAT19_09790 [Ferruginibacter sp.]
MDTGLVFWITGPFGLLDKSIHAPLISHQQVKSRTGKAAVQAAFGVKGDNSGETGYLGDEKKGGKNFGRFAGILVVTNLKLLNHIAT